MPACTSTSTTVSPTAGLPVVLSVTVPVTVAACAKAPERIRLKAKVRKTIRVDFIVVRESFGRKVHRMLCAACRFLSLLQMLDFGHQERRLVFKLRPLRLKILFRILAGAVLEVQVAQVLVELFLALQQIVQAGLLALAGEDVLRAEGVNEQRRGQ